MILHLATTRMTNTAAALGRATIGETKRNVVEVGLVEGEGDDNIHAAQHCHVLIEDELRWGGVDNANGGDDAEDIIKAAAIEVGAAAVRLPVIAVTEEEAICAGKIIDAVTVESRVAVVPPSRRFCFEAGFRIPLCIPVSEILYDGFLKNPEVVDMERSIDLKFPKLKGSGDGFHSNFVVECLPILRIRNRAKGEEFLWVENGTEGDETEEETECTDRGEFLEDGEDD
ncbi:pentatricopeptide repeat-containing protein [Sesbania bispinosa]|nr:pentatricopeptide repeat-containing protein [Sesbania bispinosa]